MIKFSNCIDIVIPVYNAFEELVACMESIKKYTDLRTNRVILINDKSSDERILDYINTQLTDNIILIDNESNLGFSGSVNRGIQYSTHDIILLNSDTIVTANWVEKMTRCAYSDNAIATVTPLSNNATICSVPKFGEDNEIPSSMTIDEYADLIEECSMREYPIIPVAMGFCMYIKREVINYVGLFDAQTYGRGYGEENDFCYRLEQLGYYHVMCDDTFIYHRGKMSFLEEEKKAFIQKNEQILAERYPKQIQETNRYWNNNPHQYIRDNIGVSISKKNQKKNILYLIQADFRPDASNNIGGTQFHVKDLTMGLKYKYNIFVAARDGETLRVTAYIENEMYSFKYYIGKVSDYPNFYSKAQRAIYSLILDGFSIDLVHVHHTLGLSLDIYYEAHKRKIPIILSLHDFYYVCPTFLLLDIDNKLCIGKATDNVCRQCINKKMGVLDSSNYISRWRNEIQKVMQMCKEIIIPSQSAKDIFCRYYPELKEQIKVIGHASEVIEESVLHIEDNVYSTDKCKSNIEYIFNGPESPYLISGWAYLEDVPSRDSNIFIEITNSDGQVQILKCHMSNRVDVAKENRKYLNSGFSLVVPRYILKDGQIKVRLIIKHNNIAYTDGKVISSTISMSRLQSKFNVAFVGGISLAKGSQIAYKLIKNSSDDINWYIFGGIGDSDLYNIEKTNLIKTGWYDREDLPMLLKQHKIDLVCILSIVPETFCFTLSETIIAQVPILATDIGALGERIRKMKCGWLVSSEADYTQILEQITEIVHNKRKYNSMLDHIKEIKMKTIEEMIKEYQDVYQGVMSNPEHIIYEQVDKKQLYESEGSFNTCVDELNNFLYQRVNSLENELVSIHSSITYKILIKLKKVKLPFKKQIKKILLRGINVLRR